MKLKSSEEKRNLWDEDLITIIIVLALVAFDYIYREWQEFKEGGINWGILKRIERTPQTPANSPLPK
jgi:hypothetical protein